MKGEISLPFILQGQRHSYMHTKIKHYFHHHNPTNLNVVAANNNVISNTNPFYSPKRGIAAPTALCYMHNPSSLFVFNTNPNNSPREGLVASSSPHNPLPPRMGMNMGFCS